VRKRRTCLKCGESFVSGGAANRICAECRRLNDRWPLPELLLQLQRGVMRRNGRLIGAALLQAGARRRR